MRKFILLFFISIFSFNIGLTQSEEIPIPPKKGKLYIYSTPLSLMARESRVELGAEYFFHPHFNVIAEIGHIYNTTGTGKRELTEALPVNKERFNPSLNLGLNAYFSNSGRSWYWGINAGYRKKHFSGLARVSTDFLPLSTFPSSGQEYPGGVFFLINPLLGVIFSDFLSDDPDFIAVTEQVHQEVMQHHFILQSALGWSSRGKGLFDINLRCGRSFFLNEMTEGFRTLGDPETGRLIKQNNHLESYKKLAINLQIKIGLNAM